MGRGGGYRGKSSFSLSLLCCSAAREWRCRGSFSFSSRAAPPLSYTRFTFLPPSHAQARDLLNFRIAHQRRTLRAPAAAIVVVPRSRLPDKTECVYIYTYIYIYICVRGKKASSLYVQVSLCAAAAAAAAAPSEGEAKTK